MQSLFAAPFDGQPPYANAAFGNGDHRPRFKRFADRRPDPLQQLNDSRPLQTFDAYTYRRWTALATQRETSVEIGVERDTNAVLSPRVLDNLGIGGAAETLFRCVLDIPANFFESLYS